VDGAVRTLVDHALDHAAAILRRNRELLDRTVVALLGTETLNEPEIELLKGQVVVEGPGSATLLRPTEDSRKAIDPPVARPTAEARARSTVPVAPKWRQVALSPGIVSEIKFAADSLLEGDGFEPSFRAR
jgi:hypothetical protein